MSRATGFLATLVGGGAAGALISSHVQTAETAIGPERIVGLGASLIDFEVHRPSLVLGLVIGIAIAGIAGVKWGEMPKRMGSWAQSNTANFAYLGLSIVSLGILLYY